MNKTERFRAMLQGYPVDHVPAGFWFHFDPEFHGGQAMAQRHIDYFRQTDLDILKVMNDNVYPAVGKFMVHRPADWAALEPSPLNAEGYQRQMEGLSGIVAALKGEAPIIATAFNPFHDAILVLMRSDPALYPTEYAARMALLAQLRQDPEPVLAGMQVIAEDLARFTRACITEIGIDGVYYSAKGGEREDLTDDEHARWVRPYDLYVLRQVGTVAEYIVGHYCGKSVNLERFVEYPVHLANWAQQSDNPSLREGKAILGGVSILGGLDERGPLVYGPREALQKEIEVALAQMGAQGFMLGAGCTVPGDVSIDNLVFAREYVAELTAE
jgi:uroporphyrinogen decarboxylase